MQSMGSAIAFLYSTTLNLHYQLYLIAVIATLATLAFCYVEWMSRNRVRIEREKSESRQDIVKSEDGLHRPASEGGIFQRDHDVGLIVAGAKVARGR